MQQTKPDNLEQDSPTIIQPDVEEITPSKKQPARPVFAVRRSAFSRIMLWFLAILACLLIISGFTFILYSTTAQYQGALHSMGTVLARSTQDVQAATRASIQGTASTLGTAQANIDATATAMNGNNAAATATVDAATATATSFVDLYTRSTRGTPVLEDQLIDNTGAGKWDEGSPSPNTGCVFRGLYNVSEAQQGFLQPCIAEASNFSNFAYQVSLSISQGYRGQAGLLFQVDSSNKAFYFFRINSDNTYAFDLYHSDGQVDTLAQGFLAATSYGQSQSSQLAVISKDKIYALYIDGNYIAAVSDATLTSGKIGVAVINGGTPVTAQFSNAQVWQL